MQGCSAVVHISINVTTTMQMVWFHLGLSNLQSLILTYVGHIWICPCRWWIKLLAEECNHVIVQIHVHCLQNIKHKCTKNTWIIHEKLEGGPNWIYNIHLGPLTWERKGEVLGSGFACGVVIWGGGIIWGSMKGGGTNAAAAAAVGDGVGWRIGGMGWGVVLLMVLMSSIPIPIPSPMPIPILPKRGNGRCCIPSGIIIWGMFLSLIIIWSCAWSCFKYSITSSSIETLSVYTGEEGDENEKSNIIQSNT